MILDTIKILTNNFETGFEWSTMLGWKKNYDKQGRLLNCDPNIKSGSIIIEGKQYWFVRIGYKVRLWDSFRDKYGCCIGDHLEEMDIKPDYVKEYEASLNAI